MVLEEAGQEAGRELAHALATTTTRPSPRAGAGGPRRTRASSRGPPATRAAAAPSPRRGGPSPPGRSGRCRRASGGSRGRRGCASGRRARRAPGLPYSKSRAVAPHREAHVALLPGDAELAEQLHEVRVGALVEDDEAGVHRDVAGRPPATSTVWVWPPTRASASKSTTSCRRESRCAETRPEMPEPTTAIFTGTRPPGPAGSGRPATRARASKPKSSAQARKNICQRRTCTRASAGESGPVSASVAASTLASELRVPGLRGPRVVGARDDPVLLDRRAGRLPAGAGRGTASSRP